MRAFLKNKRLFIWLILSILVIIGIKYYILKIRVNSVTSPVTVPGLLSFEEFIISQDEDEFSIFPDDTCQPKRNVLYIKGHHSKSANIQNLFFHHGDRDDLAVILVNMEEYYATLKKQYSLKSLLPLNPNHHSETLFSTRTYIPTSAAEQNFKTMKSILPADTIFLTDLTDSVSLTDFYLQESSHQNTSPSIEQLENFLLDTLNTSDKQSSYDFRQNQMAIELGFDKHHSNDQNQITKFIQTIDSQFHFVMIEDRIDEFLIHLYHLLCWPLDDLVIFRHSLREQRSAHNISNELAEKIRSFNNIDELLYKHFNEKLTHQTKTFGKSQMTQEINHFKQNIKLMYEKCIKKLSENKKYNLSDIIQNDFYTLRSTFEYNLDRKCYELIRWEAYFIMMPSEQQLILMESNTNPKIPVIQH